MKQMIKLSQICPEGQRLTLVIGSGVNSHSLGNKSTILTSWERLLYRVFGDKPEQGIDNYIIAFERWLVKMTSRQNEKEANQVQEELLIKLCKAIRKEQTKRKYSANYPLFLFNKEITANVISLNFDLIPEYILSGGKIPKMQKAKDSFTKSESLNLRRYREINGIRFWHPHGDEQAKRSLILGMRQYIDNLSSLEVMRRSHKSAERTGQRGAARSWYEALVNHPVIVLGASLSDNELDIWGALINRERNYAKRTNRKEYRPSVYIMWSEFNNVKFDKYDWIKPLFPVHLCYQEQWRQLEKMFKKYDKN